jgi:FMN phosphatase YigB (HAD superfamily)
MTPPTALIFDIGQVLVTFDFNRAWDALAVDSGLLDPRIKEYLEPLIARLECGDLPAEEFLELARIEADYTKSSESFRRCYVDIFDLNTPMAELVPKLAEQWPLYLLSNTSQLHLDHLRETFPLFQLFRGGAFSHLSRSMKPSPKIYLDALAAAGVPAESAVFLDDNHNNVAAAQALGLRAFPYDYTNHTAAVAWLWEQGVMA